MMTNLYHFVMGQAALKPEHIPTTPVDGNPDNHVLAAHCGYFGVVPQSFSKSGRCAGRCYIVDDNAHAIVTRFPLGPVTLVKLTPPF